MAKKTVEIRDFVIVNVEKHPKDIASVAAKEFGVTRQAINKHIRSLIAQGILSEEGSTRAKIYKLFRHELLNKTYKIGSALAEDQVYSLDVVPKLKDTGIGQNLSERCHYCFTEIFNNAIEHSEGTIITLNIDFDERNIYIIIDDNGVGIFKKIMKKFDLEDERVAIFELSKGKLTTEPAKHTGEGIFFSSRISDSVQIDENFILGAAAATLKTDQEFSAAIALSFRIDLVNMFFAGDLYAGTGVVVDPSHPPKVGDSLENTQRILRNKPFAEYFTEVFAPYYWQHRPGATAASLLADNRLDIIGDALRSGGDYYGQSNSDDLILNATELKWLRDTLGPRIAVYDHGGHLGNVGSRQQVSDMLDMLAGRWPVAK